MAKGKKLNLFIGANIEDGWSEVQTPKKPKTSTKILEAQKHSLVFKKEKRRGKVVTLVGEFHLAKEHTSAMLKSLKKKLGCGGAFKDGWMEFQGEPRDKLKELLEKEGFKFHRELPNR